MKKEKETLENNFADIRVIFEDDNLLVLNKPSGIIMHSDGKACEKTIADWLIKNYSHLRDVGEHWESQTGEKILRPGIVHRLDKNTSGVVLIAKTYEYFSLLKSLFKQRKINKEYRAFLYGGFKEEKFRGVINLPIARSVNFGKFTAIGKARGERRDAETEYEVLTQTGSDQEKDFSFVSFKPKTGRTHQIRVHAHAIHHPVVCDKLYAPKKPCALGFARHALHAYKISFFDGQRNREFFADFPDDFKKAIKITKETGSRPCNKD